MGIDPPIIADQRPDAADITKNRQLFASLYGDLRRLAERQLRRSATAVVSPTTLLHEAYIGMADREAHFPDQERFMGYAARVMRGLIIDLVRERCALKRGGAYHITQLPTEVEESAESAVAPNTGGRLPHPQVPQGGGGTQRDRAFLSFFADPPK